MRPGLCIKADALPFDPGRVRPELVGLHPEDQLARRVPAPSRLAQRDVAKTLVHPQAFGLLTPGAGPIPSPISLGRRADEEDLGHRIYN